MPKVKVAIVMGIYNCENYIKDSIESIINQTYNDWHLIMCDDASTDKTFEIAESFQKKYPKKITLLKNDSNKGLNYTLNKCIKVADCEYIARQDGDDISLPERLEKEVSFLDNHKEYSLVSCNMIFFDDDGDWGMSGNSGEVKKDDFVFGSPICHASCMMRKKDLLSVGGYSDDKKYLRVEDYHLWFKFYIKGLKCYSLDECYYKARDDDEAYKRRNFRNRFNETRLKWWGFNKIGISKKKYIWVFKPIVAFILPRRIYNKVHITRLKENYELKSKKKKYIAQFVGSMNCGGTETMLMNILRHIDSNKYEFTFIENVKGKSWYTDEIISLGHKVVKISPFSLRHYFKYKRELKNILKEKKYDVVHSHVYLHSGIVLSVAKKCHIPVRISHSHSSMRKNDNNWLKVFVMRKMIVKNATNLLACSKDAGVSLFGKNLFDIVHNPIDYEKIKSITEEDTNKLLKKYNLTSNQLILGSVGRLEKVKNHAFLIELASKLKDKNIVFKMFFIGDGSNRLSIEKLIEEKKLTDDIIMVGNTNNVFNYMKLFDFFLMPSLYEGLPLALIEAQSCNNYCIVSSNVSRESDLNLNNIKFMSINEIDKWEELIENMHYNKKIDQQTIENKLDEGNFLIESVVKKILDYYN